MKKDIVIVGSGLVGMAMACSLAELGMNIGLLDTKPIQAEVSDETDLRVYAINHASQILLTSLDVWQKIADEKRNPYRNMYVWDALSDGILDFRSQELARSELGHIIEEKWIKHSLLNRLKQCSNVSFLAPYQLSEIDVTDNHVVLTTDSGGSIHCQLVIGADGANSWLRDKLDFQCRKKAYSHHAIVCHVHSEQPHQRTAYQIFTKEGPLAFLPLHDSNHSSIVWSMSPDKAHYTMSLPDQEFLTQLYEAFQHKLGQCVRVSKRVSFPLFERVVDPYIKPRVALIGDALHTIHPLAGLGMNLGLADVATLAEVIAESGEAYASHRTLRRYERQRKGAVMMTTKLMKLIQKGFLPGGIPAPLRAIGMNGISSLGFIKKAIIDFADSNF